MAFVRNQRSSKHLVHKGMGQVHFVGEEERTINGTTSLTSSNAYMAPSQLQGVIP
jgi:hypothetical protein